MNIIVLNLPRETSQVQLAELFKAHGKVESCDLVMDKKDGKSKGFGFVEMSDVSEANNAIAELHGKKIGGNKIRVKVSDKTPKS